MKLSDYSIWVGVKVELLYEFAVIGDDIGLVVWCKVGLVNKQSAQL